MVVETAVTLIRRKKLKRREKGERIKSDTIPEYYVHLEKDKSALREFFGAETISMRDLQTRLWNYLAEKKLIVSK
jgi:hypothetical protein